eukprot:scaffold4220_cov251-Pinguiococcus_pyrenoidosus.AAC.4
MAPSSSLQALQGKVGLAVFRSSSPVLKERNPRSYCIFGAAAKKEAIKANDHAHDLPAGRRTHTRGSGVVERPHKLSDTAPLPPEPCADRSQ